MGSKDDLAKPSAPQVTERVNDQVDGGVSRIGTLSAAPDLKAKQPVQNKPEPAHEIIKIVSGEKIPERRGDYIFPPINLLNDAPESSLDNKDAYAEVMMTIIGALEEQSIRTIPHEIHAGPVYTRYQITLAPGVTYEDVAQKHGLLAQSLGVPSIKAVPIDGEHELMGVMVPNDQPQDIVLRDIIETKAWAEARAEIPLILGKNYTGRPIIEDLHQLGHLLVVGQSGSGSRRGQSKIS